MGKYVCAICGYIYDPALGDSEGGIAPGTAFADLPADWVCPECGASKEEFVAEQGYSEDFDTELRQYKNIPRGAEGVRLRGVLTTKTMLENRVVFVLL